MEPRGRVFFRSLGCPKNQVDSELMLGSLALEGYVIAERLEDADIAVVNTCSFIESAREESIEVILDIAEHKQNGGLRALLVAGCLPQRYGRELARELPEVDAFVGTGEFPRLDLPIDRLPPSGGGPRRGATERFRLGRAANAGDLYDERSRHPRGHFKHI